MAESISPIRITTEKTLSTSFFVSLVVHAFIFSAMIFLNQTFERKPMLQLREIDIVEPVEIQPEPEPTPVVMKKSVFELVKQVIPLKQRVRRQVQQAPPKAAPKPKVREVIPAGPLIAKKSVINDRSIGSEPLISKKSIGMGTKTDAPRWEGKGPGARAGGGGNLNLALSTILPEAQRKNVADADMAASLQGKRGGLSLHTSNDVNGIVANVGQGKNLGLAGGRGGNAADLKGFRDAFSVFGEIKHRKILRLKMPKYPAWAEEQGIEASTTVRVGVLADGTVDDTSVYVESTSGYPELDNLAIAAAKMFIFAALPPSKSQAVQYGSIRFAFQLKH
jgi:TonB family protein